MVHLADVQVSKDKIESVLDACCGSGGFLILAMSDMLAKAEKIVGLTNRELNQIQMRIRNDSLIGIDAAIYRIARMNMYLHGDAGANVYFADAIDKNVGMVRKRNVELDGEIKSLRGLHIKDGPKFDVILSNPGFSLRYSRDSREQQEISNEVLRLRTRSR